MTQTARVSPGRLHISWIDNKGILIPTANERADKESHRADAEQKRADAAEAKARELEEKLRKLGVAPFIGK